MTGEILIKAIPGVGMSIEMDTHDVSRLDVLACFDLIAAGFHIEDDDRQVLGTVFAQGGLNTIPNMTVAKLELDKDVLNRLKNKKDGSNGEESQL